MEGASATCRTGLRQLILTVCDFLAGLAQQCQRHQRQFQPLVESKIKSLVREFLIHGSHHSDDVADAELRATMASWAIFGAAIEWSRNQIVPAQTLADSVLPIVLEILKISENGP